MRRRIIDVGRIKRLPSRRTRTPEVPPNNTLLHFKIFCGWSVVVLLDILVGFRLEYLYPAIMFIRSVLDSYRYQGLVFSILFIVLVIYLDMLCWTLLLGPWLFLIASACVWLEMIRNWDHIFGYSSILLWMFFLYVEISQRMHSVSPAIVSFSRPFAAHCIGYPVITMSFLIKHHLLHVLRQRQQKLVAEENHQCFQILLRALPPSEEECEDESDRSSTAALEDLSSEISKARGGSFRKKDSSSKVSSSGSSKERNHRNSGRNSFSSSSSAPPTKRDPSPSINTSNKSSVEMTVTAAATSVTAGAARATTTHHIGNGSVSTGTNSTYTNSVNSSRPQTIPENNLYTSVGVDSVGNGVDIIRPSSATTKHHAGQPPSGGKKQALVKAVPRTDLQQQFEAREKASKSNEVLLLELKDERQQRNTLEQEMSKQQKDIKRLHADLHASRLQEEEAGQRITVLMQQDRLGRLEIQRMRNETENMQQRLSKLSTGKSRDMETISSLEEQLRAEISTRQRLESQLREQRTQASSQTQWSREEVKEIREKLNRKEKELSSTKDTLHHTQSKYRDVQAKFNNSKREITKVEEKCQQLESSLSDVTRVKIELFSYLSEATRKQEALIDELRKKNEEIENLKQQMQHLVAMQSTWTPTLSPHPH